MVASPTSSGTGGGDLPAENNNAIPPQASPKPNTVNVLTFRDAPEENDFSNEGGARNLDPSSTLHRNVSNQSTIDSGLSRNSHLDMSDPNIRRMFGLSSSSSAERQRRLRLMLDQCETVRFPFKKRLILANMNLSFEEIPVEQIVSDRLGPALYKLSLAGNRLHAIPEMLIVSLSGLRVLDFSQCDLHSIPDEWDLPSLKKLNLSHNRIKSCLGESVIRGLPELQHLDMYGNKLTKLCCPTDTSLLTKLEYLDVGYNHLTAIPDEIANLPSLRTFKCMNNAIEVVPAVICEMDLRSLDVSSNPLVQPPLETCARGLNSMRRYYHCLKLEEMAGPEFQQAPPALSPQNKCFFKKRVKMRKKKEAGTRKTFPSSLCRSSMFRTISEPTASFNTSSAPSGPASMDLGGHTSSAELGMDLGGSLPALPGQETLPMRSVSFSLKGTQDRLISDSSTDTKGLLKEVQGESDWGDSAVGEPAAPATMGLVGLDKAEKRTDEITVNDTLKVIFVGMAYSGKTSIIKRLIEGKDAKIPQKDERTIGVDIYEWDPKSAGGVSDSSLMTQIPVDGELESRIKGNVDVKFSVWDFAGQHVYHATHELFFSAQSLYVLVWDMGASNADTTKRRSSINEVEQGTFKLTYDSSDEEDDGFFDSEQETRRAMRALEQDIDEKLQFWIDCIQSSAPGAAILPVASFDDRMGNEEATVRCKVMRERLLKHEERRVKSMKQRLREYESKFGASSELAGRLRKLLCPFNRPKIIFGTDGESVVRVSSTKFSGFDNLAERIVNIATGRERGGWTYPIFRGHLGARIPRMRLEVRDAVRNMRDRFKVVEWNYFLSELQKRRIDNAADVSDALHFLANIGELSYFGEVAIPMASEQANHPLDKKSSSLYEDRILEYDDEELAAAPVDASVLDDTTVTLGLSDFVFLNPRWLVAAVACILRHDLTTEIYEVRRALRNAEHEGESLSNSLDVELKTDVNYPVITARDACLLWQNKRFTKKAADRALQYSADGSISPYDFLERLLVRFGVFVPIDLSMDKALLGGRDYSHYQDYPDYYPTVASDSVSGASQTPKFFFLPSLLGPGESNINDIWTFKTVESWKTTICHTMLFPDGVPPGLMERITASILSDLYTNPTQTSLRSSQSEVGHLRIKETLCWRSAFYLKIGSLALNGANSAAGESITEIFATLVDQDSQLCVASDSMGVGMRRLIFSGKGQAGDTGSKIWAGGYMRVLRKAAKLVMHEYSGLEIERQAVCPQCLAKKPIGQASVWDHSTLTAFRARGEQSVRCRYGHMNDFRLICGSVAEQPHVLSNEAQQGPAGEADIPVSDLLKAVVIVGIYNEKDQRIVRVGSGFFVDKKRGFIVTAGHTLMDRETWREVQGKIVIGVVPNNSSRSDPVAVFRYFARIIAKDPSINENDGVCTLDACVLQVTTRMENDVMESGRDIGEQPETLLQNNPVAMKTQNFAELNVSQKYELDEAVRILGFNQGGEGRIAPGEEINRCADFARGYVVMKFRQENSEQTPNRNFQPKSEIVVICPTIGGHSGGPCVNQQGEVIGILSRADPADRQRCYLVPSSEWLPLVKTAKKLLR